MLQELSDCWSNESFEDVFTELAETEVMSRVAKETAIFVCPEKLYVIFVELRLG